MLACRLVKFEICSCILSNCALKRELTLSDSQNLMRVGVPSGTGATVLPNMTDRKKLGNCQRDIMQLHVISKEEMSQELGDM